MADRRFEELREKMLKETRKDIQESYKNEEFALMQAINAYNETNKSYNLLFERLSEWFGIYFPEVRISNQNTLVEIVPAISGGDLEEMARILGDRQRAESIQRKVAATMGRHMNDDEKASLFRFALLGKGMKESLDQLGSYIKKASTEIMPNTTYLTDEKIAAELLSKAGSLERLASMPASTIQLLGAEKALFKHIKFGSKSPKYGVIFKLPAITNAPRDQRGRIARIYATKIGIGLKGDFYTKKFIGERLKADIEKAVAKVRSSPPRQRQQRQQRQRPQRQNRRRG